MGRPALLDDSLGSSALCSVYDGGECGGGASPGLAGPLAGDVPSWAMMFEYAKTALRVSWGVRRRKWEYQGVRVVYAAAMTT